MVDIQLIEICGDLGTGIAKTVTSLFTLSVSVCRFLFSIISIFKNILSMGVYFTSYFIIPVNGIPSFVIPSTVKFIVVVLSAL
jgi:hypothetical protein